MLCYCQLYVYLAMIIALFKGKRDRSYFLAHSCLFFGMLDTFKDFNIANNRGCNMKPHSTKRIY